MIEKIISMLFLISGLVVIILVLVNLGGVIDGIQLCEDRFDKFDTHYRGVNKDYYNCCWYEVKMTDNGYIEEERCMGFER